MSIKDERTKLGITAERIAKELEISKGNYSKKENGIVKFSLEEAYALSKLFDRSIEELFFNRQVTKNETKKRALIRPKY